MQGGMSDERIRWNKEEMWWLMKTKIEKSERSIVKKKWRGLENRRGRQKCGFMLPQ